MSTSRQALDGGRRILGTKQWWRRLLPAASPPYNAEMDKRMAVLRIGLGLAQIMGATVAVYLLMQTGASNLTIVATIVTLLLVMLSRLLFGKRD